MSASSTYPLASARAKQAKAAVEFLIETYRRTTDEITLVAVGPLTNVGIAIALDPRIVDRIPEIVIMGGAHWTGNVTPAAEFNVWADPEASALVFQAPFRRRVLVPLDATHKALVSQALAAPTRTSRSTPSPAASSTCCCRPSPVRPP